MRPASLPVIIVADVRSVYPHDAAGLVVTNNISPPESVMFTVVEALHEPGVELTTETVYEPAGRSLNSGDDWKFVPSIL